MGILQAAKMRLDGFANVVAQLGIGTSDRRSHTRHVGAVPVLPAEAASMFRSDGMVELIVAAPADDATSKWVDVVCEDDQGAAVAVADALETLGAQHHIRDAIMWGRLLGGCLVVMMVDDGMDPSMPVNEANVRSVLHLRTVDRREVVPGRLVADPLAADHGEPETYILSGIDGRQVEVHKSRVLRFGGATTDNQARQANGGWDDSVLTRMRSKLADFDMGHQSAASLLMDFAQPTVRIEGLSEMLAADEDGLVQKRIEMMMLSRSVARVLLLDTNEEYSRTPTPVTGMPELLDRLERLLSAVTGIPVSRLMGRSAAGMNATGEGDERVYYDRVIAYQARYVLPQLERLVRLLMLAKNGPTQGKEPEAWSLEPRPLQQASKKERGEVAKLEADTVSTLVQWDIVDARDVNVEQMHAGAYVTRTERREEPGLSDLEDDDGEA